MYVRKIKKKKSKYVPQYVGTDGRMKVKLINKFGVETEEDVAEIVAKTYLPSWMRKDDELPKFKDGNPKNCSLSNLYY